MIIDKIKKFLVLAFILKQNVVFAKDIDKTHAASSLNSQDFIQVFLALVLVVFAFILIVFLLKKINMTGAPSNDALRVIAGLSLGTKEKIVLIEAGKKQILVGVCQTSINTLHVFDEPLINASDIKNKAFVEHLKVFINKGR